MTDRLTGDRYVNPYTDFGFKMLFGTEMNKELGHSGDRQESGL